MHPLILKMNAFYVLISLGILFQPGDTGSPRINGTDQVFTVQTSTTEETKLIYQLYLNGEYDFWTAPLRGGSHVDIMARAGQVYDLTDFLQSHGLNYSVKFSDVRSLIREEQRQNEVTRSTRLGRISWDRYATFHEISAWLKSLNTSYSTVSIIGYSSQHRPIYAVTFSTGGPPKKSVLIDANIHAREWIAGATATWIINELAVNTTVYLDILKEIDIHIVPIMNPDGYVHTHSGGIQARLWRKTRSVQSGSKCVGCDPNRNFGFHWDGESTSSDPCSDIYRGVAPFSEPEVAALVEFVTTLEKEGASFLAYLTLHAYGKVWLLPWGYTQGVYPDDYADQLSLGQAAIAAVQSIHGTRYHTGQGADLLYGVGGASDDFMKNHGIKYTATVEMRGDSFILPPAQIVPNAQEVWAGIQEYFKRVIVTS